MGEVKSFANQNDNIQPSNNTYKSNGMSSDDINNLDKYKNMQGVGSDMLNDQKDSQAKVNMANYNNCSAMSSDQMFGREDNTTPGKFESLNYYDWEDKIKNAKEK